MSEGIPEVKGGKGSKVVVGDDGSEKSKVVVEDEGLREVGKWVEAISIIGLMSTFVLTHWQQHVRELILFFTITS